MASIGSVRVLEDVVRPYLLDPELRRLLPLRPLLARECRLHPADDALVLVGGRDTLVVEGREAITELLPLIRAFDGRRDHDEIAADLTSGRRARVMAATALLFSCGLVEDAPEAEALPVPDGLSGILGSGVAKTFGFPGRAHAWAEVAGTKIWLAGDTSVTDPLAEELRPFLSTSSRPEGCRFGVFALGEDAPFDPEEADAAVARGTHLLMVERSGPGAIVGPLLTRSVGPTARCFAEFRSERPRDGRNGGGNADDVSRIAVTSLLAHHVVSLAAHGVSRPLIGTTVRIGPSGTTETRGAVVPRHARRPDGSLSPLPRRHWKSPAWERHVGIQDLPACMRPVRGYDSHFTPAVVALTKATRPLPPGRRHRFTREEGGDVAEICRLSLGLNPETGRPFAPSGGGLRSPILFVHLGRGVGPVPPGTYAYDGTTASLHAVGIPSSAFDAMERACGDAVAIMVVVGAVGVLRMKYGPKSFNLACFDAGILTAHVALAVEATGRRGALLQDYVEEQILGSCGLASDIEDFFVSSVFSIGGTRDADDGPDRAETLPGIRRRILHDQGGSLAGVAARGGLETALRRRRAVRDLSGPLDLGLVEAAIAAAEKACAVLAPDVALHGVEWVGVSDGRLDPGPGVWRFRDGVARRVGDVPDGVRGQDLVIQKNVGDAPCVLLLCLDLARCLDHGDGWGYRAGATAVGVALAVFWLELAALGAAGSPCGGFVGGEMRAFEVDGHDLAAMLSFGVGRSSEPDAVTTR